MNTNQILASLKTIVKPNVNFDVISADKVKNIINVSCPKIYIVNLQPSHMAGSHWVVIHCPKLNDYEVFDSYGQSILTFGKYFNPVALMYPLENCKGLQSLSSDKCSHFCLYYAYHRMNSMSFMQIVNQFGCSKLQNDEKVRVFYENNLKCNSSCLNVKSSQSCCTRKINMYNKVFI